MSKVLVALAASVDGYITGPDPNPQQPLGIGGDQLFDWYRDGDTQSAQYPEFSAFGSQRPGLRRRRRPYRCCRRRP